VRELAELVLASASPRRRELLAALGLPVRVVPSGVDEGALPGRTPLAVAEHWARAKAEAVAAREPRSIVLAADTVVDLDGTALGKPRDDAEAAEMLRRLSGRTHAVHTAYVLVDGATRSARASTTHVRFHALAADEIAAYVATGDGRDKAGAYGIQGRGATLVEAIAGDFYTVMGFPIALFARDLRAFGYRLPSA